MQGVSNKRNLKLAIPFIVIASIFLAAQATCVKIASQTMSSDFLVFARSVVTVVFTLVWVAISRQRTSFRELFKTTSIKNHVGRAAFGVGALYCFFYAIKHMALPEAVILLLTLPIFVPVVSRFWLRHSFSSRVWWGVVIGLIGVAFLLRPDGYVFNQYTLIGLLSGLLFSIALVSLNDLPASEPAERSLTYYFIGALLVSGFVLVITPGTFRLALGFGDWMLLLLIGVFAFFFHYFMIMTARYAHWSQITPFLYVSVFLTLFPFWNWGGSLSFNMLIGMVLVVLGAILVVLLNPKDDLIKNK